MINEFGAKNFYSFKDWAVISCQLDNNVPESISNGLSVTPVLGIKGNNGSGKTNVLKILIFIKNLVLNIPPEEGRIRSNVESYTGVTSFFDSVEPSEFFIDFDYKGKNFLYEFSVTKEEIITESLKVRENIKRMPVFERHYSKLSVPKKYEELKKIKLRKDVSVIQHVLSFNFNFETEIFKDLHEFFLMSGTNITASGITREYTDKDWAPGFFAKYLYDNKKAQEFVISMIKKFDLGISNIYVDKKINAKGEDEYIPYFVHKHDGHEYSLSYNSESNGTKKLFISLLDYFYALISGSFLALDEFDNYLHPLILPSLIELFTDCSLNESKAQFIFTTHNIEIMNLLGKYRTLLVEKENNESICYRIDELSGVRGDRPISDRYLKGDLGGVPKIE